LKIILDAGHYPNTPGKRSPDGLLKEFQFNSRVADLVKNELQYYQDVQVKFSHAIDRDVPLSERCQIANNWNADCFVSIHANAFGNVWNNANGIETYIYKSKPPEALTLAAEIQTQLIRQTGRFNRGVKTADFYVLRHTKMTAILVECGFMTNKDEAELLKSEKYRLQCARSIIDGLVKVYNLKPTPKIKPQTSPTLYRVQVGAFSERENAESLANQLKRDGYNTFITEG
jgi:N-acetylmuramoyl-L-alanine amidase